MCHNCFFLHPQAKDKYVSLHRLNDADLASPSPTLYHYQIHFSKKVSFFCSKHFLLPGTLVEKKKKKQKQIFNFLIVRLINRIFFFFLARINTPQGLFQSQTTFCSWCIAWLDVLTTLFFFQICFHVIEIVIEPSRLGWDVLHRRTSSTDTSPQPAFILQRCNRPSPYFAFIIGDFSVCTTTVYTVQIIYF